MTEQQRLLSERGVVTEIVPGVPAFAAAAAAPRLRADRAGVGQSPLITRVSTLSTDMPPGETLPELAAAGVTLALHLAAHRAQEIVGASPLTMVPTARRPRSHSRAAPTNRWFGAHSPRYPMRSRLRPSPRRPSSSSGVSWNRKGINDYRQLSVFGRPYVQASEPPVNAILILAVPERAANWQASCTMPGSR